ncbi:hypothetical protein, partial [Lactobacillus intestinalis]
DNYMAKHFKKLTGREFQPVKENKVNLVNSKAVKIDERGGYIWKEDLKQRILDAFYNTDNFDDFETVLEANNGVKIKHRRASVGKDEHGKKVYRDAITYSFIGDDGASHLARDFAYTKSGGTRGLGLSFTPQAIQHEFKQRQRNDQQVTQEQTETISEISQQTNAETLQQLHQQQLLQQQINQRLLSEESEDENYGNQSKKSVSVQQYKPNVNATAEFDTRAYDAETQRQESDNKRKRDQIRRQRIKEADQHAEQPSYRQQQEFNKRPSKPKHAHQPANKNRESNRVHQPESEPIIEQHQHNIEGPGF